MASAMRWIVGSIALYAAAWTLAYVLVMGRDFTYFLDYFLYAWSGGGEIPTAILWISLAIFIVTMAALVLAWRFFAKGARSAA